MLGAYPADRIGSRSAKNASAVTLQLSSLSLTCFFVGDINRENVEPKCGSRVQARNFAFAGMFSGASLYLK